MEDTPQQAGDFDVYLLALSWNPSFCCRENLKGDKEQCKQQENRLILHGLWPAFSSPRSNKFYPQCCPTATTTPGPKLKGLKKHQWAKHGTCSGLSQALYFSEAQRVMQSDAVIAEVERTLQERAGATLPLPTTKAQNLAISATPHCQLRELTLCFSRRADFTVGDPIPCPLHILKGDRNSATLRCNQLVIEETGSCQVVTKALQAVLKIK